MGTTDSPYERLVTRQGCYSNRSDCLLAASLTGNYDPARLRQLSPPGHELHRPGVDRERLEHEQLLVVRAARLQVDPADEEVADVDLQAAAGRAGRGQHTDHARTSVGNRQ